MPRLQPPEGYITAHDAAQLLGVSDALLSRYVNTGKLQRYGPKARVHKFYKLSEVEALREAERVFQPYSPGGWKKNPSSLYEQAHERDMPAIVEISRRIFGDPVTPAEKRVLWFRKNPETFYVLRNQQGIIIGYASILPLPRDVIDRFIKDEIETEDISANNIEMFEPGKPLHIYIMSIGIDPQLSAHEKHEYGSQLVRGLFNFFLELAQRGIEIETITARSHKPDGLRLLRKMGFPQLHSPVPGKSLFMLNVPDSGFPLLERYKQILMQWQQAHAIAIPTAMPERAEPVTHPTYQRRATPAIVPKTSMPAQSEMPEGLIGWRSFAKAHGVAETTVAKAIKTGRLQIVEGRWKTGMTYTQGALDEAGRARFFELWPHAAASNAEQE